MSTAELGARRVTCLEAAQRGGTAGLRAQSAGGGHLPRPCWGDPGWTGEGCLPPTWGWLSRSPCCLQPAHCCRYPVLQLPLPPARAAAARAHLITTQHCPLCRHRITTQLLSLPESPVRSSPTGDKGGCTSIPPPLGSADPEKGCGQGGCSRRAAGDMGHPALSSPRCGWGAQCVAADPRDPKEGQTVVRAQPRY